MNQLSNISEKFQQTDRMPVLFLGHGNPMNAIEENQFVKGFQQVAETLPKPNAILCISAHWTTNGTKVTAMKKPRTIHDFSGFPKELYEVQYPAKGSPELANTTKQILHNERIELDEKWGLDHGAWSVIKHLYPKANVPVVELSLNFMKTPGSHYELAKQLNSLREKGILIIGSGNIIHNLSLIDFQNFDKVDYGFDWAKESRETINSLILDDNHVALFNYAKLGKAVNLSIPTPEHFLPLIYILALKNKNENISLFNDQLLAGSLSMTSLKIE